MAALSVIRWIDFTVTHKKFARFVIIYHTNGHGVPKEKLKPVTKQKSNNTQIAHGVQSYAKDSMAGLGIKIENIKEM